MTVLSPSIMASRLDRNSRNVLREPRVEGLQLRVERARELDAPGAAVVIVEVALELEHVAEVLRAGESEATVDFGGYYVVEDLAAQRLRESRRHLAAREVLARDADLLADELPA